MMPEVDCRRDCPDTQTSTASSDVFGNDLGDVDIWGDESTQDWSTSRPSGTTMSTAKNVEVVVVQAISIAQRSAKDWAVPHVRQPGAPKPPKTPSTRRRMLEPKFGLPVPLPLPAPVLQQAQTQNQTQKGLIYGPKNPTLQRSGASEGDMMMIMRHPNSLKKPNNPSSGTHFPPMTPRTRMRKLGMALPPSLPFLVAQSQSQSQLPTKPKQTQTQTQTNLTVAERRRKRSEELSIGNVSNVSNGDLSHQVQVDAIVDANASAVGWKRGNKDGPKDLRCLPQSPIRSENIPPITSTGRRRARASSDGYLAQRFLDFVEFGDTLAFGKVQAEWTEADAQKKRDSQANRFDGPRRKRSSSANRKNQRKSQHKELALASSNRASLLILESNRNKCHLTIAHGTHERTLLSMNSGRGRDEKLHRSNSFSRKDEEYSSIREQGSISALPRNDGQRSIPSSGKQCQQRKKILQLCDARVSTIRSSSVPRTGDRIKYVRNKNRACHEEDERSDSKSTHDKPSLPLASKSGSRSSSSQRSGRRASLTDSFTTTSNPRRRRAPTCPPSPVIRCRSDGQHEPPKLSPITTRCRSDAGTIRRNMRSRSPAVRKSPDGVTTNNGNCKNSTPTRNVRYLSKVHMQAPSL